MKILTALRTLFATMIFLAMISCSKEEINPAGLSVNTDGLRNNVNIATSVPDPLDLTPAIQGRIHAGNFESLTIEATNTSFASQPEFRVDLNPDLQVFYDGNRGIHLSNPQFRIDPNVYNHILDIINTGISLDPAQGRILQTTGTNVLSNAEQRDGKFRSARIVVDLGQSRIITAELDPVSINEILPLLRPNVAPAERVYESIEK